MNVKTIFYGLLLLRLQLVNSKFFVFLLLSLPNLWNIFFLISMSWQCRYRTNVCVRLRSLSFFKKKKKEKQKRWELERHTDDHTLNMFATGRQTVGDPSVATCLMMICIFSQLHEKKRKTEETCVCFRATEQERQAAAFSTYLFFSLFI